MISIEQTLTLRPITEQDQEFLYRLYASTRADEMALVDWSEAQKANFLRMQFDAQHQFYMQQFPLAKFQVMMAGEEPIGRLYTDLRPDEIRIVDIALLPEHQRQGIGTRFLEDVLEQGRQAGLPVRIHVEHYNPALHFYYRLGFQKIGDTSVYLLMERQPEAGR